MPPIFAVGDVVDVDLRRQASAWGTDLPGGRVRITAITAVHENPEVNTYDIKFVLFKRNEKRVEECHLHAVEDLGPRNVAQQLERCPM
jgi:hypothetical protein